MALAAVLLFALWYTWPTSVSPDFVVAARDHIARSAPSVELVEPINQTGRFGRYELRLKGLRDGQAATVLVSLEMTAEGPRIVQYSIILGSFSNVPLRLAQMAMTIAFAILVFFWAVPQTFGKRCPRDGSLLAYGEKSVFPSRYGRKLVTLAAIIQRTWSCPKCDFRHVEARPDPNHRPVAYLDSSAAFVPHVRMSETVERTIDDRRRDAIARSITDEQYTEELQKARDAAAELTSSDSPWRR